MQIVYHTLLNKNIREFNTYTEAKAYCKFLNLLCYSKANGASQENCFAVSEVAF